MLDFGLMPNRLFPAQLPCYEGQPGELKADPYIFVGSAGERPGRTARANGPTDGADSQAQVDVRSKETKVVSRTLVASLHRLSSLDFPRSGLGISLFLSE